MITRFAKSIERRKARVRAKIVGTKARPRLSVYRSNQGIYAQLIDDAAKKSIVSASWKEVTKNQEKKMTKTEIAEKLGECIAQKAKSHKISTIVFDRSGYKYHGRVKAVAEAARKNGLLF